VGPPLYFDEEIGMGELRNLSKDEDAELCDLVHNQFCYETLELDKIVGRSVVLHNEANANDENHTYDTDYNIACGPILDVKINRDGFNPQCEDPDDLFSENETNPYGETGYDPNNSNPNIGGGE